MPAPSPSPAPSRQPSAPISGSLSLQVQLVDASCWQQPSVLYSSQPFPVLPTPQSTPTSTALPTLEPTNSLLNDQPGAALDVLAERKNPVATMYPGLQPTALPKPHPSMLNPFAKPTPSPWPVPFHQPSVLLA